MRAMQIALYLIDSGRELKDGERVGSDRFVIATADAGHFEPALTYVMTAS
jgi:hypothetical protein